MNPPASTSQLSGEVIRVADFTVSERSEMFSLMSQYYDNMCRKTFDSDFDEKDWVIVARDKASGAIMGFSTQLLFDLDGSAGSKKILFSGDTIIDRAWWSKNPLAQLWGRLTLTLIEEYPEHDLFWFLISKGYKTYRFLPVFFKQFYPWWDVETPGWATMLIHQIASQRYPDQFDETAGIVRAHPTGCQLRAGVADLTSERLGDKHIDFFRKRNPGHTEGDELCCLASLTRENYRRGAWRVIGDQVAVEL